MGSKAEQRTHWGEWQGPRPPAEPKPKAPRERADSPFFTTRELAELLRISHATIYRLLKSGRIKGAFKVGSDWRFDKASLEDWIAVQ